MGGSRTKAEMVNEQIVDLRLVSRIPPRYIRMASSACLRRCFLLPSGLRLSHGLSLVTSPTPASGFVNLAAKRSSSLECSLECRRQSGEKQPDTFILPEVLMSFDCTNKPVLRSFRRKVQSVPEIIEALCRDAWLSCFFISCRYS